MTKTEAKLIAQRELAYAADAAFYKLWDGYVENEDGTKMADDEKEMVAAYMQQEYHRLCKLFRLDYAGRRA